MAKILQSPLAGEKNKNSGIWHDTTTNAILVPLQDPGNCRSLHWNHGQKGGSSWSFPHVSSRKSSKSSVWRSTSRWTRPILAYKRSRQQIQLQWTYGNLQKDRPFFFTLIHQAVFKNGGLNCSTSFWGRQKHQPFLPSPGVLGFQGSAQHQEDAASEPRHGHGDGRHFVDPTTDAEYRGNGQTRPRKWRPGPERWKKNEAGGAVSKQNNVTKLNWLLFGNFTWQWRSHFLKKWNIAWSLSNG